MVNWAKSAVFEACYNDGVLLHGEDREDSLAALVCRAKADGMREANQRLATAALEPGFDPLKLVRELVLRAAEIEKGNA